MSTTIAEQIARIQAAKEALATSITNKGVTVPSGANISTYSAFVDQIPSGSTDNLPSVMQNTATTLTCDCTSVKQYGFAYCRALTYLSLPSCTTVAAYGFWYCSSLTTLDLGVCTSLGTMSLRNCSALTNLYLRSSTLCDYANTSSSYDPTNANLQIHVPADLLSTYQSATNWSRLSSKFVGDL